MAEAGYTTQKVARITGLSPRQLSYWRKTGLLVPGARTPGGHARYTFTDLIALKAAKRLLDAGASLQGLRRSITSLVRFLPNSPKPLAELSLVATGDVVLVFHREAAFDTLTGQQWILPVAELEREMYRAGLPVPAAPPVQGELFPEPIAVEDKPDRTVQTNQK